MIMEWLISKNHESVDMIPKPYLTYDIMAIQWYAELMDMPYYKLMVKYPHYRKPGMTKHELAMAIISKNCP